MKIKDNQTFIVPVLTTSSEDEDEDSDIIANVGRQYSPKGGVSTSADIHASFGDSAPDSAPDSAYHTASSSPANTLCTPRLHGSLPYQTPSRSHLVDDQDSSTLPPDISRVTPTSATPTSATPPSSRDVTAEFEPNSSTHSLPRDAVLGSDYTASTAPSSVQTPPLDGFYERRLTKTETVIDVLQKTGSRFSIHAVGLQILQRDSSRFNENTLITALEVCNMQRRRIMHVTTKNHVYNINSHIYELILYI